MNAASTERVRFTISVEAPVYEAFADLAEAAGVSMSRCIGDWLRDTSEAAQITTIKVNEVRKSPQAAFNTFIREAMGPEVLRISALREAARGVAGGGKRSAPSDGPRVVSPPSSNTGGKGTKHRGGKGS